MAELITLKRKRGVVKASITRITTRLTELEDAEHDATSISHARLLLERLQKLDDEFRTHHLAIVETVASDELAAAEQEELDNHDEKVASLQVRLETFLEPPTGFTSSAESTLTNTGAYAPTTFPPTSKGRRLADRHLDQLDERVLIVSTAISKLTSNPKEIHLVDLYSEQLGEFTRELADIHGSALTLITDESDALITRIQGLDCHLFELSVTAKQLLYNTPAATSSFIPPTPLPPPEAHGVKLPKIDVPTFSGELLSWRSFWEQFCIAIHDQKDISTTERLAYLRHALKDGSAKSIIEGLSASGEQYSEAIALLQTLYDRPRLLHQTHVRKIYKLPKIREGTGKELRKFHDIAQQHLRALKAMGKEPSGPFITSLLELKLDQNTIFEWQKFSQNAKDVPSYTKLLEFINLRAEASESCSPEKRPFHFEIRKQISNGKHVQSLAASTTSNSSPNSMVCKTEKYPLYACQQFKAMPQEKMLAIIKSNHLCLNCLRPGHITKGCKSNNHYKKCQRHHHMFLHVDSKDLQKSTPKVGTAEEQTGAAIDISSNTQASTNGSTLLMTCQVLIHAPDSSSVRARGLLDSGSSTSFISERMVQTLKLRRSTQNIRISDVVGITHRSPIHSVSTFDIAPLFSSSDKIDVSAIVVPQVTRDLLVQLVLLKSDWSQLSGLYLADPDFGRPGKIDILLSVDICAAMMLQGRRSGPQGRPITLETKFGWVLAGKTAPSTNDLIVETHHVAVSSGYNILRKFWEIKESPKDNSNLSPEERAVVRHFNDTHYRTKEGRFMVPLLKNPQARQLGKSWSQAVRRFMTLEWNLHSKGQFPEFARVMEEYMQLGHAELVPVADLQKLSKEVFYMPMHAVRKEHSTTTNIRAVIDASAKTSTGASLNGTLLVGPTVHTSLIDILLRFRLNCTALAEPDRDLHRFVWRSSIELVSTLSSVCHN